MGVNVLLHTMADDVGSEGPVTIAGSSSRGGAVAGVRCVAAPAGIDWVQPDEMTVQCGAGTPVADLAAALADVGQRVALPDGGTVGGALAMGRSGVRRLGDGPVRDTLLQTRYVSSAGEVVQAGGPTVKNVSGFDVCRLLVGSQGTLGFLGDVILRTRPVALSSRWFRRPTTDPFATFAALYRPVSVLWDGTDVWVLLEGHPADVDAQASEAGLAEIGGPPILPAGGRVTASPSALHVLVDDARHGLVPQPFVAEIGVGVVHIAEPTGTFVERLRSATAAGHRRILDPSAGSPAGLSVRVKERFDPTGRLNPGVVVG